MMTVQVKCNQKAMFYWALQYGTSMEVLEPIELREKLYDAIEKMAEKYKN
jgi:predicted DNA-binding transcriptional regulator YafY